MTEQNDPHGKELRKKWAVPAHKRGKKQKMHLMSDNSTTFCGRRLTPDPKLVMDFDDWCPLDHPDKCCPRCLEWFNTLRPGQYGKKKKAES